MGRPAFFQAGPNGPGGCSLGGAERYEQWWEYISTYLLDGEGGSWFHELDADNEVQGVTWPGKPDIYHALQATLIARLPAAPVLAAALRDDLLDADLG